MASTLSLTRQCAATLRHVSNFTAVCAQRKMSNSTGKEKKSTQLKKMLTSPDLEFIMEAHNGLSAKIVQEADTSKKPITESVSADTSTVTKTLVYYDLETTGLGFKGIWGSGLSVSAQLGVRDSNEASWTQVVEVLEFMSDATSIPILLDADTGYGNFNNARRLVRKLEDRGIAGACLEDKLFPKTNSLHDGRAQPLADISEFSLKIKACKDTQTDPDFCIVARVEAFIAGWGLDEALRRAEAYRNAGADAILMHSKKSDPSDIEAFMKAWNNQGPVVIVPTKYYKTPTQHFQDMGVSMVIWANHNLRASVKAIQKTTAQIFKDQSLLNVENEIVSVKEIFRLQEDHELVAAEDKYLPKE